MLFREPWPHHVRPTIWCSPDSSSGTEFHCSNSAVIEHTADRHYLILYASSYHYCLVRILNSPTSPKAHLHTQCTESLRGYRARCIDHLWPSESSVGDHAGLYTQLSPLQYSAVLARPVANSYSISFSFISFFAPLVADCTLLVRVFAVYPPSLLPWPKRLGIYGPILLFKLARLVNNLVFDVNVGRVLAKAVDPLAAASSAWTTPEARIEWFLQTFDNTLSYILFPRCFYCITHTSYALQLHFRTFLNPSSPRRN